VLILSALNVYGSTLSSAGYKLVMPRVISSAGSSSSEHYSLVEVGVGGVFSGTAESANYSLNATYSECIEGWMPNMPILDAYAPLTNIPLQELSGTKDPGTSIYIDGSEMVSVDTEDSWYCNKELQEGENTLEITAHNNQSSKSSPVYASIELDTVPPCISVDSGYDKSIVTQNPVNISGTSDDLPFTQVESLEWGLNPVAVIASDAAGNSSCEAIEIYLVREPLMSGE